VVWRWGEMAKQMFAWQVRSKKGFVFLGEAALKASTGKTAVDFCANSGQVKVASVHASTMFSNSNHSMSQRKQEPKSPSFRSENFAKHFCSAGQLGLVCL